MSEQFTTLQGYAIPFLQAERRNGRREFFDPDAFDDQLAAGGGNAFLNFAAHESEPIARPLALFKDSYGIAFSIAVSARHWRSIGRAVMNDCQYCSIFADGEESEFAKLLDGTAAYRITRAKILHVTLCADPCYRGTGVWPSEIIGEIPARLRKLRARWSVGWQAWRNRANGKPALQIARTLAARAKHYDGFRKDAAAMFAQGAPLVIGHAAFSKASGFAADEFMSQIANARVGWKNPG